MSLSNQEYLVIFICLFVLLLLKNIEKFGFDLFIKFSRASTMKQHVVDLKSRLARCKLLRAKYEGATCHERNGTKQLA